MARIMDRKEAILFLKEKREGRLDELSAQIGETFFKQFSQMGFIKRGVSKNTETIKTWQITKLGEAQSEFYREPSSDEKERGKLYSSLGI
ncbi:MAG: hypothetical protein NC410_08375 [Oscillibacter sp.]|nr:hypothetical protein [Oscillibacter sp.]